MQLGTEEPQKGEYGLKLKPGPKPKLEDDLPRALHLIRTLAGYRCTQEEIATALDVGDATLSRFLAKHKRAREAYEAGVRVNTTSLRRRQFEVAMDGNVTMLIWLGKQHLGQRDKFEVATNAMTHEDWLDELDKLE